MLNYSVIPVNLQSHKWGLKSISIINEPYILNIPCLCLSIMIVSVKRAWRPTNLLFWPSLLNSNHSSRISLTFLITQSDPLTRARINHKKVRKLWQTSIFVFRPYRIKTSLTWHFVCSPLKVYSAQCWTIYLLSILRSRLN